jgi:hypothetical protein
VKRISRSLVTLLVLAGVASADPVDLVAHATTAGATKVPVCLATVLTIKVGNGGAAAGNLGFPVLITNHGSTACSLDGFPTLTAHTEALSPRRVTFVHTSRSQIYATAKAKLVVVAPKGTASFGVSFVDALDQQYGEGPRCLMNGITVRLPGVAPLSKATISFAANNGGNGGPLSGGPINSCFAGFEFGLTPIVKGSIPPYK